ncbi:MAG TPA: hypothetical protein VK119_03620 [Bacillota bacterium]|nr:hypothetical protein [Bacillota bacterium]
MHYIRRFPNKKFTIVVAILIFLFLIVSPVNAFAFSTVYDEEVDYKYIKYGLLEVRDHDVQDTEVNLTYYTHYSLNMRSKLKNSTFHLKVDEALKDNILDVKVKVGKKSWTSAEMLNDETYAINHKDVLKTGLIGVNQQFDIKIVLNDRIQNLSEDFYTTDIALFDRKNRVVVNTTDGTYFETNDKEKVIENNNLVTGSGYTVANNNPSGTEIKLDYVMHYKLNASKHKRGQFQFSIDEKLLPFITEVRIKTRDGKFKPVVYDENGNFDYSTNSLVSHSLIGIRQGFSVEIKLEKTVKNLPNGIYLFNAYQTTGDGKRILDGTDNSTYFLR